jgi:hypothetical protein
MPEDTPTTSALRQYRYFVSYFIGPNGFGNSEVFVDLTIRGIYDVKRIADILSRDNGGAGVVVLNYIQLPD